jgi:hypothetical protein
VNPKPTAVTLVRQDAIASERRPLGLIFMLAGMLAITEGIAASRLRRR